ncbi:MAG TPA: cytidylate kinase-like family protein [Bacteroidaceae bacterium]|nr:cytidylate kinase-like family protein [Bacteroidaceae bacterium]
MKTKFAINIGREIGSGGHAIAEIIAQNLGINLYDKKLLDVAAKESGFGKEFFEKADEETSYAKISSFFSPHLFEAGIYGKNYISNDNLFKIQSDAIRSIHKRESCLFIGRCADYILRESPYIFNVFITANIEDRINNIVRLNIASKDQAIKFIEKTDRNRSSYYNFYSGQKWGHASHYDLSLNSSIFGYEKCAEIIIELTKLKLKFNIE